MAPSAHALLATPGSTPRSRAVAGAALLASLVLLLVHARYYGFLTDDAFISFRYAANLAEGHGLVFNIGERVEGYTNFLWVVILGALDVFGWEPHVSANPLSLLATLGLWASVAWYTARTLREGEHPLWIAVPCFGLAITRSVAVWSTGGLETRLFEFLVVSGCISLMLRLRNDVESRHPSYLLPAILFALATLTRPDGGLFAASSGGVAIVALGTRRRLAARHATAISIFVGIVAAHFLFRRGYYGEWLPNTYYAKVSGQDWFEFGELYALAFAAEYFVYAWLPALAAATWSHVRQGTWFIPAIVVAAVGVHAAYVISIGGDHFEYRPFDVYFPLLFLLIGDGLRFMVRGVVTGVATTAYAAFIAIALVAIPWQTHVEFPERHRAGFPGFGVVGMEEIPFEQFADASRNPFGFVPGITWLQPGYQRRLWELTANFVGLRQEEHAGFAQNAIAEGKRLAKAVADGQLRPDAYFAMPSVGAIPYFSGFRVLDRNGLTDRRVARSPAKRMMMAHAKSATRFDAKLRGVEFWTTGVSALFADDDHNLYAAIRKCRRTRRDCFVARIDEQTVLLVELLQGYATTAKRYPKLEFVSADDEAALADRVGLSG